MVLVALLASVLGLGCGKTVDDDESDAAPSGGATASGGRGAEGGTIAGASTTGGAPGIVVEPPPGPSYCSYGGRTYALGDRFRTLDGCNDCECVRNDSKWEVSCTERDCAPACVRDAESYSATRLGDDPVAFLAADGCSECTCIENEDGATSTLRCITTGCACIHDGRTYAIGDSFRDACDNACRCEAQGRVACEGEGCVPACRFEGRSAARGESFPSRDGCNECVCYDEGVPCSAVLCECAPFREWWRRYSSGDDSGSQAGCPAFTRLFSTSCGSGCEQDADCPEWIDCTGNAGDCSDQAEQCPFSTLAVAP
jgi:hypothetical protein